MILLDANLLIYAYASESDHHEAASTWFEKTLASQVRVGFAWPTLLAFVRLLANPHVVSRPVSLSKSWSRVEEWLALPQTWVPLPTDRHRGILSGMLAGETRADVVIDAHLAALAVEHGLTVYSADRDFARFTGVTWKNPLSSA